MTAPDTLRTFQITEKQLVGIHMCMALPTMLPIPHADTCLVFATREFALDLDLKDWGLRRTLLLCACTDPKSICAQCWIIAEMAAAACHALLTVSGGTV